MNTLSMKYPVPLNRAALMSQLQLLAGQGYHYWHAGSVSLQKAAGLLEKFASLYPVLATPSQRATNKKKGIANVQLLWGASPADAQTVNWFLLATRGKTIAGQTGFADAIHRLERMKYIAHTPLLFDGHYVLHQRLMEVATEDRAKKKRSAKLRWTWSMSAPTFAGWRDQVVQAAHAGDRQYQRLFSHLTPSPMFAGIRADLTALESIGRDTWRKSHGNAEFRPGLPSPLPIMPRIQVFGHMTLADLIESTLDRRDTVLLKAREEARAATEELNNAEEEIPARDAEDRDHDS